VALQGTLDTFALPDVLRLLAATKKTGRLRIAGSRGNGSVWVSSGEVCATEATHAPHATTDVDALFELLRFTEGSFAFEADVAPDAPGPGTDVELLLAQAEELLAEWRQIEAIVPSLDAYVTLRRTLDAPAVEISQEHWTTLVAVGGGATVAAVADALELAEIPVSRAVRDLADLGVIEVAATAPASARRPAVAEAQPAEPAEPAPLPESAPVALDEPSEIAVEPTVDVAAEEPVADTPSPDTPAADADADALPTARPIRARRSKVPAPAEDGPREPERFVPLELPGHSAPPRSFDEPDADADAAVDDLAAAFPGLANRTAPPTPEDEELARQLATLSPRAADAVRAAAEAGTDEERDAALDAAEESEDAPINRGLLLKFLSSVKS
jgi:hypothetical protein